MLVQSCEKNLMIDGVKSRRHIQQHQDDILTTAYKKYDVIVNSNECRLCTVQGFVSRL